MLHLKEVAAVVATSTNNAKKEQSHRLKYRKSNSQQVGLYHKLK